MYIDDIENLEYEHYLGDIGIEFNNVSYDSRNLQEGDVFICLAGSNFDTHNIIEEISKKNPALIVIEKDVDFRGKANIIKVESTRKALALFSAAYFSYPAKHLKLIGITGTKGKTSTAYMLRAILKEAGINVGMIGTTGIHINESIIKTQNTTPESFELHKYLKRMLDENVEYVVMEVSSQAVKLDRIYGLEFEYGIFTNISPDHISEYEHKDFEEYLSCKIEFLSSCKLALINKEMEHFDYVYDSSKALANFTYGSKKSADFYYYNIKKAEDFLGTKFLISGIKEFDVELGTIGTYNVSNAMSAIAVAIFLKIDIEYINKALKYISIDGRMDIVYETKDFTILVDYAHNENSMKNLLDTLKEYRAKRIVLVFGCGGNRSKDRRYGMGKVAANLADFIIITEDNSRFENVEDIVEDIVSAVKPITDKYKIIYDRSEAIRTAILEHKKGDLIAVIGKGHEDYQEIRGKRIYFKDREEIIKAVELLKQRGVLNV